jgi:hypothetical protein
LKNARKSINKTLVNDTLLFFCDDDVPLESLFDKKVDDTNSKDDVPLKSLFDTKADESNSMDDVPLKCLFANKAGDTDSQDDVPLKLLFENKVNDTGDDDAIVSMVDGMRNPLLKRNRRNQTHYIGNKVRRLASPNGDQIVHLAMTHRLLPLKMLELALVLAAALGFLEDKAGPKVPIQMYQKKRPQKRLAGRRTRIGGVSLTRVKWDI